MYKYNKMILKDPHESGKNVNVYILSANCELHEGSCLVLLTLTYREGKCLMNEI